jgi:benzil reductase ((S)-benzoin forming)
MAKQQLFVLTGASRGMGAAIAQQLVAQPGHRVLCLSRQRNASLENAAGCEQWAIDLAQPVAAVARVQAWLAALDGECFASATLINNAAALTRIGAIDDCA